MALRKKIGFLCWGFWCVFAAQAQLHGVFLDQLSVDDGLSQSSVSCVLKDSQGFVWLGTADGLNQYDSHQFIHHKHNPFDSATISNDHILCLYEDSKQNIWVGTADGLNRYDRLTKRFVRYNHQFRKVKEHPVYAVSAIHEDQWHTLWVGTSNGLWRMMPQRTGYQLSAYTSEQTVVHSLYGNRVRCVFEDKNHNIWIGTRAGLNKLITRNPEAEPVRQQVAFENIISCHLPLYRDLNIYIESITQDAAGKLWVGTGQGLRCMDPVARVLVPLPASLPVGLRTDFIRCLRIDRDQTLWVGTATNGIFRLRTDIEIRLKDNLRESFSSKKGLKSNNVSVLYQGRSPNEDIVWIGTEGAGVQLFSYAKNSFRNWDQIVAAGKTKNGSMVFSICTDRHGYLWVGTLDGLVRIDSNRQTFQRFQHDKSNPYSLAGNSVLRMMEDSRGNFWIGTATGLQVYDRRSNRFLTVGHPEDNAAERVILSLYEDSQGDIWVGTQFNLKRIERIGKEQQKITSYTYNPKDTTSLIAHVVNAVHEDKDGNIWVGTDYGLNRFDRKNENFAHFLNNPNNRNSIMSNQILSIYRDRKNQLWICTGKGLSRMVEKNDQITFVNYTEKDGLPNSTVYGVLEDKNGNLWMSTNLGLSRFNPATGIFKNYDSNDGLAANEFNAGAFHKTAAGEMFFGGVGALVSFTPETLLHNRHIPNMAVTSFKKFGTEMNLDSIRRYADGLVLNHDENYLSFLPVVLDYTNPRKNRYAYKLEGFGNDCWTYIEKQRDISFTNLEPGRYTLHIKGANNEGLWNTQRMLTIPIRIRPPFWQTWWFYLSVACIVGVTGWLLYNARVRYKVRRLVEMERVVMAENERVRKLAAQDLHDEFGNALTRISILAEIVKNNLNGQAAEADVFAEAATLLDKISENARRLYQGTKDFIWSINPEHDNFYEIAIRLKDFGDDIFDRTPTQFSVNGLSAAFQPIVFPMGASRHLILIFKEAMSNTLKYAQATEGQLSMGQQDGDLYVEWRDNGISFDVSLPSQSNGLINMHSRAKKIGGELQIISQKGVGTTVFFRVKSPKMGEMSKQYF